MIIDGDRSNPIFILAHGAGADSRSEFMTEMARMISEQGICVVRFDFPYMIKRQEDGKKRPPDRAPKLIDAWLEVIEGFQGPVVIGGKSMGGRIASLVTNGDDVPDNVKGCACLGYPFHPPGKPDSLRTEHLATLKRPLLMAQGTRDAMGTKEEVEGYTLDSAIEWHWLEDGNHDLKPRKASGFSHQQHMESTAVAVAEFVKRCL